MESCRPLMNKTRGRSRAHQAACVRLVSPRGARVLPQVPRHLPRRLRRLRWVPRYLPRHLRRLRWVPRHLPRRLRRSRKSRGICRDICASCASPAAFAETFAQAAQVPRYLPRRLRKPRKSRGICRDVCASRASPAAFAETFAQAAQAVKSSSGRVCLSTTIGRLTDRHAPTC